MKLTPPLAQAIMALLPNTAFRTFLDGIQQDGTTAMMDLVTARPDAIGQLQGRAQASQEILGAVAGAAEYLTKISPKLATGEYGERRSTQVDPRTSGAF